MDDLMGPAEVADMPGVARTWRGRERSRYSSRGGTAAD
jgi:hypothetical protein